MSDSINSVEYRRLMRLTDPDDQFECTAAEYNERYRPKTANDYLRDLDTEKPARAHPELDWRRTVVEAAELAGWKCYWTWNSIHSPAGFPDLVLVKGVKLIFAELKTETGKTTAAQDEWLAALVHTSALVQVWRPSMWNDIVEVLRAS